MAMAGIERLPIRSKNEELFTSNVAMVLSKIPSVSKTVPIPTANRTPSKRKIPFRMDVEEYAEG